MVEHATGEPVYAEQVRYLYRLSRAAYPGTLVSASIIVYALWGLVPTLMLGGWLCAIFATTAARYLLYRAYFSITPPPSEARTWARRFVVGAGAAGLLWGFAGSALYPVSSLPHQLLVIFLIGGMVVSAMVILAPVRQAFLAYMLPAMALVTATVFAQGTNLHLFMGVLLIVFLAVMVGTGPVISEMVRESLRFRFQNASLVERLSQTNRELSGRIAAQQRSEEVQRQTKEKFEALIEASPLAIIVRDAEGRVEKWNAAAERLFGFTEKELLGKTAPLFPPGREQEGVRNRELILRGETFADVEGVRIRKDGTPVSVSISAAPVHDSSGKAAGYLTIVADVTERKRAEQRQDLETAVTLLLADARSLEEVMPRVIHAMCQSLGFAYGARWVVDNKDQVMRCAETWCVADPKVEEFRLLSAARVETPGLPGGLNRRVWATSTPCWITSVAQEATLRRREFALEAGLQHGFGFPILVGGEFYGVMEFFGRGTRLRDERVVEVAHTVGIQIGQFIARKQAETNLQFFASHDPLTGLFNRGMFNQRLQQAVAQAQRFERSVAILFIDLDGFKVINDTLGHNAGDALLAEIATRLRATLREGDVIARMGGDEFVVLIEEFGEPGQIGEVAKKVLETVARPFLLQGQECQVTASLGISTYPDDGKDAQTLVNHSDIAMYRAKEQGKNNFRFYAPQMNVHLVERLSLESNLRRAIERNELLLLYQPKVSMRDGQITGVEALVRWQHPTQGVIGPAEFVPVAEDAGLITVIGEWVIHTACRQLRAWRELGLPVLRAAVNLSHRQLAQESLIQVVRGALHQSGVDPVRLELEITEAMVIRNPDRAEKLLAQLKELGVRLVIDDFGTGLSSLNYLKRMPIDCVKIDRSLILDLPRSADAAALTRAVVAMAHSLGIRVTAESVETREQWEFLHDLGCEEMQGNYFSAPVPADIVTSILQQPGGVGRRASVQALRPRRSENGPDPE
ncbi:MAG: EAL domain-containing protein [Betaproteobacteria bacterium]|nr:EAL domain-containing protein [Betaproteobacteria bacterium]